MFRRLISAAGQSRSAKTVEVFGWLILFEGTIVLFAPHFAISVLGISPLTDQGANYFRLVGLLVSGLDILYIASGRLNAEGFVFASMLDRPSRSLCNGTARSDFFNSRLRQLSLDTVHLVCRTAKIVRGEFL